MRSFFCSSTFLANLARNSYSLFSLCLLLLPFKRCKHVAERFLFLLAALAFSLRIARLGLALPQFLNVENFLVGLSLVVAVNMHGLAAGTFQRLFPFEQLLAQRFVGLLNLSDFQKLLATECAELMLAGQRHQ